MNHNIMSKIILLLAILLGFIVIAVLVMQLSTNSIMREIRGAFFCSDFYVEDWLYVDHPERYADPSINYVVYTRDPTRPNINARYSVVNHSAKTKYIEEIDIDLKLWRVFAWHNFRNGTLWFRYSVAVTDKEGQMITGSLNIPVRLSIERVDGSWVFTDLYEPP